MQYEVFCLNTFYLFVTFKLIKISRILKFCRNSFLQKMFQIRLRIHTPIQVPLQLLFSSILHAEECIIVIVTLLY